MRRPSSGGMARTYAPVTGGRDSVVSGVLTIHVLEAEKITLPGGGKGVQLRPYAKLRAEGKEEEKCTGVAVGSYLQMWRNESYEFEVVLPGKVNVSLYHKPSEGVADHVYLGVASVTAETRNDCGSKWLPLHDSDGDATGGQIKLRWDFQSIHTKPATPLVPSSATHRRPSPSFPDLDKSEGSQEGVGKLKLEIIRAKGLTTPEYWISFSPYVVCRYQGKEYETRVQKNTTNPFYNCRVECDVKEREPLIFHVMDPDQAGEGVPREYGCVGWDFDTGTSMKPMVVPLQILKNLDDVEPPENMGVLELRVAYKPHKTQPSNDPARSDSTTQNGVIQLGYEPVISGSVSIVPEDCQYIWFNMYDDAKFKMVVEQRTIEAYLAEHVKAASPGRVRPRLGETRKTLPITMDSVIINSWESTRLRHVVDLVRLCAEKIAKGGVLPLLDNEIYVSRVKLAEMAIMRMKVIKSSSAIGDTLESLWSLFSTGSANPTRVDNDEDDHEFNDVHYKSLTSNFLQTFIPGISASLANSLADTEWDEGGHTGRDESNALLLKDERFRHLVSTFASVWCDTLTEYEIQQFLSVVTPVVLASRKTASKMKKRRGTKLKVVRDSFKKPEHLDDLGHRLPKNSNGMRRVSHSTGKRGSSQSNTSRPPSSKGRAPKPPRPEPSTSPTTLDNPADTNDHYETILRSYRKASTDSFGSYGELTRSSIELRSSLDLTKSNMSMSETQKKRRKSRKSLSGSMKKTRKRSVFGIAEEKVKHDFEMEDMDWGVVTKWANEVFGGFQGGGMEDVLKMGPSEVDMVLLRLFPNELPKKHPKVRSDLVSSVVVFFQAIRSKEPPPVEQQSSQVGQSKIPEGCLKVMLGFCEVPVLKKLVITSKATRVLAEGLMSERIERLYPLVGEGDLDNALKAVFTPVACDELRHAVALGKLKTPPRLAQVVAEMASTLLAIETNGYWAKFREVMCSPHSYSYFLDYSPASLTSTVFKTCLRIKEDSDSGIDRQGRQLDDSMRGVSWVTLTEETLTKTAPGPIVLLYKWIKLLMMTYSRHAGRTYYYVNTYGWTHKAPYELYWD